MIIQRGDHWQVRVGSSSATFRTKTQALQVERDWKSAKYKGVPTVGKTGMRTVRDIAEEWLASDPDKEEGSVTKDESGLRLYIYPPVPGSKVGLGDRPIGSILRPEIQTLVNSWRPRLADASVLRIFGTLRAVFTYAEDNGYLVTTRHTDPCRGLKLPARKGRKADIPLTRPTVRGERPTIDMQRLGDLAKAMGPCELMVHLALAGPRWGEIAGLKVKDIDFGVGDEPTFITLNRQITRGRKGRKVVKDNLKSEKRKAHPEERIIAIGPKLADKLYTHIGVRGLDEEAWIFTSSRGQSLDYADWYRDFWVPARDAVFPTPETPVDEHTGRRKRIAFQFQYLRKIATQILDEGGVGTMTRQRRLGNTPEVQKRNYLQATLPDDLKAADLLDAHLTQMEPGTSQSLEQPHPNITQT